MGEKGENSHTLNEFISWKFGKLKKRAQKVLLRKSIYKHIPKGGNRNKLASEEVNSSNPKKESE